jgi:hypothetical protein
MDNDETLELLAQNYKKFNKTHVFRPGDLVEWKPGLRNKKSEGPFVVDAMLDSPVLDLNENCSTAYFREPLDVIVCAQIEMAFVLFHLDSRRLQPFTPAADVETAH